jgi:PKD repeat protein
MQESRNGPEQRGHKVVITVLAGLLLALVMFPAARIPRASAQTGQVSVFTSGPYTGAVGTTIVFSAQASVSGVNTTIGDTWTFTWAFGDGTSATGQSVSHTYTTAGTFSVTVTAATSSGLSGSATTTATVGGGSSALTVTTGGPYTAAVGSALSLSAQAYLSGTPTAATYTWSFGDGTSGTGQSVTHAYAAAGSYSITVTATTSAGQTGSATTTAQVGSAGAAQVAAGNTSYVSINGPYSGAVGSAVTMSAQAYVNGTAVTATYAWSFGDGATGSGQSVTHAYTGAGAFNVAVTATTPADLVMAASTTATIGGTSGTATTSGSLTVITGGPYTTAVGTALSLAAQAYLNGAATPATYTWTYGDGASGSGQTTSHVYATAGSYSVTVAATTSGGQTGSATTTVTVGSTAQSLITGLPSTTNPFVTSPYTTTPLTTTPSTTNPYITSPYTTSPYTTSPASTAAPQTGLASTNTPVITTTTPATTEQVTLYPSCNNVALTWPNGTAITAVAAAISPSASMTAIWEFDNTNQRFLGYSSRPGAPNDITTVNRGDAVFVCMNASGSLARPGV